MIDGSPSGFLGAGYIADWHAAALRTVRGAGSAAVCDRDEGRAQAFAARHGVARVYTSLGAMLSEGRLDAIHVLLPPDLHAQAAGEIIDAGLHVLLEKPMAIDAEACEDSSTVPGPPGSRSASAIISCSRRSTNGSSTTWHPGGWGGPTRSRSPGTRAWASSSPVRSTSGCSASRQNIMLEVGPHSVAHMLDLVGPAEILGVQATNPLDLPGGRGSSAAGACEAGPASVGVTLNFSFAPGSPSTRSTSAGAWPPPPSTSSAIPTSCTDTPRPGWISTGIT